MKSKKIIIILILLLSVFVIQAQTNYANGYSVGYKEGYCYKKTICVPPLPPISPIPEINEDIDSYQDGYNRGFYDGLEKQKLESNNTNSDRYQTSAPKLIDNVIYTPPFELMEKVLQYKQQTYDSRIQTYFYFKNKGMEALLNKNYMSAIDNFNFALNTGFYDAYTYFYLGLSYYYVYYYDSALSNFENAKKVFPDNDDKQTYSNICSYISKANSSIKSQERKVKNDYTNYKTRTPSSLGIKTGALYYRDRFFPSLGVFYTSTASNNKKSNWVEMLVYETYMRVEYNEEVTYTETWGFEALYLRKRMLSKRFDLTYGLSMIGDEGDDYVYLISPIIGAQFYIRYNIFLDANLNYQLPVWDEYKAKLIPMASLCIQF